MRLLLLKNRCVHYCDMSLVNSGAHSNPRFTTFIPIADNSPLQITQRETMNNHRRGNGIGAYHSCIIFLLLIMVLIPSAAAADTMFRSHIITVEEENLQQINTLISMPPE